MTAEESALKLYSFPFELQFDEVYFNVVFEASTENIGEEEKDKK